MPTAGTSAAAQTPIGDSSQHRWEANHDRLAELLPVRPRCVLVDGPADQAKLFASRLAEKLGARRYPVQVTLDANGPWDVTVFLRTAPGGRHFPVFSKDGKDGKDQDERDRREHEERADVVIDLRDLHWPVIRRVA